MLAGIIQRGWLVYVLLVIMGLCLYKTMKGDPGYVPLHPDLTTAKKVGTVYTYVCIQLCVYCVDPNRSPSACFL